MDFKNTDLITVEDNFNKQLIREATEIHKTENINICNENK